MMKSRNVDVQIFAENGMPPSSLSRLHPAGGCALLSLKLPGSNAAPSPPLVPDHGRLAMRRCGNSRLFAVNCAKKCD
jgi:hypothetical protein